MLDNTLKYKRNNIDVYIYIYTHKYGSVRLIAGIGVNPRNKNTSWNHSQRAQIEQGIIKISASRGGSTQPLEMPF